MRPVSTDVVDYESLVADYNESLTTTLRGFRPALSFLEMWVPDEDPAKSVLNLVEAAESAGVSRIAVFLGPNTARAVDTGRFVKMLSAVSTCEVRPEKDGLLLVVSKFGPQSSVSEAHGLESVQSAYRDALAAAGQRHRHEGELATDPALTRIEATADSLNLSVLVDPTTHVVRRASYRNASSLADRGLLETLCEVITDVPVREAADHAAISCEYALRDPAQPRPVPGIILPANADPMFSLLVDLTRQLVSGYEEAAGPLSTENHFDRVPSARWAAMTQEAQVAETQAVLTAVAHGFGYHGGVTALRVDDGLRVTIRLDAPAVGVPPHSRLFDLERALKSRLEPGLQLYLEEQQDRNTIRTLITPKELANVRND